MNANVYAKEKLIGTVNLQPGDITMGCLYGTFIPNSDYVKYVQPTVHKINAGKINYSWQSLGLTIQLEDGPFLYGVGGITISDAKGYPNEPVQLDVAGLDAYFIELFSKPAGVKVLFSDPWESISIEQKLVFEEELKRELGQYRISFFSTYKHVLSDAEFFAMGKYGPDDDVLFRIKKPESNEQLAVVHLTWTGQEERNGYPGTELYNDYDDFINSRMIPDMEDWQE